MDKASFFLLSHACFSVSAEIIHTYSRRHLVKASSQQCVYSLMEEKPKRCLMSINYTKFDPIFHLAHSNLTCSEKQKSSYHVSVISRY